MSEYLHVEKPFFDQLAALGWKVIDQGQGSIPSDPTKNLYFVARVLGGRITRARQNPGFEFKLCPTD